ncbi:prepilin-type N-terminal cleavage/methylation domain-containing protein [Cereibacter sphaeroides]|nr:prepilin-type N-terminal cleavage/methylation domain-containing protein [Cereibacter sphaeroides]
MTARRRTRGFTLIELLAAMAILAVVSVMAVQALSGVFFQRSVLGRVDDRAAELMRSLSYLRQDLSAAVALGIEPPEEDEPPAAPDPSLVGGLRFEDDVLVIPRGGLAVLPGQEGLPVGHVVWQLRDGALYRDVHRSLALPESLSPDTAPLLSGVTDFALIARNPADEGLAAGWEVTLQTEAWGALRLVVAR